MPSLDPPGGLIPNSPDDLTPHWLASVFIRNGFSAAIESIDFRPIEASSLTSRIVRVVPRVQDETTGFAPALLWKRSLDDPQRREAFRRGYASEVGFYRDDAPRTGVSVPRCFAAAYDGDTGAHVLVLEDLTGSASTGLAGGVTPEQAAAVLSELARLHASEWSESTTPRSAGDFARLRPFVEQHAAASTRYLTEQIDERASARTRRYAEEVAGYFASLSAGPQTRTHGDAHPGNVLIPRSPGARPVLIDWQGSAINAPLRDVSRFLTLGLSIEDRQAHEEDLLHGYLDQLATRNVHYDPATALRDYRTALLLQWGWAVLFFRHEPIWDRDTRAAMPALVRRAAAAFDDALAGLDLGVTNS